MTVRSNRPWVRWVRWLRWPLLAAALWAAAVGAIWWGQETLLFRPSVLAGDHRFDMPADVHERWVEVPGARLNALHLKLPKPDGIVYYLHGNAGDLQSWFKPAVFRELNLDLFMIDYRGYGKSSGSVTSEAQLIDDVRRAWQAVAPEYAGLRRVFFGRSLGTGPATQLAAEVQPELTVLVSAYRSLQALATEHYPFVPAAVLRYPMRTDLALPRVQGPVLLLHGERDTLIPAEHSRRLAEQARRPQLVLVPEAGHNDIHRFDAYLDALRASLPPPR